MSTAAGAIPAFLRSLDLPEPGELRRVARVYVWGRWFVWSLATFAWLYPLNVDEVVYAPNVALAMLLFATNGYLHYRLATERTVFWRWMLALSALDLAMLSAGVAAHRGFESPFFVGYYPSLALFAVVFGSVRLTLVWVTMAAAVYTALCLAVEPGLDFSANDEEILLIRVAGMYTVVVVVNLISRVERIRRMEAVEREGALLSYALGCNVYNSHITYHTFKGRESHEHAHAAIVPSALYYVELMRLHLAFGRHNSVWSLKTPIFRVMRRIQQRQPNGTVVRVCLIRLTKVRIHHSGPTWTVDRTVFEIWLGAL